MSQPKPITATPCCADGRARQKIFHYLADAEAFFKCRQDHIRRVLRGYRKTAFGYKWSYAQ